MRPNNPTFSKAIVRMFYSSFSGSQIGLKALDSCLVLCLEAKCAERKYIFKGHGNRRGQQKHPKHVILGLKVL